MTRRLLASLFVLATAFGLVARADRGPSPVKVPTKKTEKRINETDPKATLEDAAVQQDRLKRQFDDVKQALLRLAQRLEASSKPEDQEKAKVLRKAIKQAGEMGVDAKFSTLVALLKDANTFKDGDQLAKVLDNNKDLRAEIRKLIELLLKDDRDAELKRQREETAALLERLKELIARQERLQTKTDIGRTDNKKLKDTQDDLAKDTRKLYDPNAAKKTFPKAEAKYGGKDGKGGRGEAKDDAKDPKAGNKGEEGKGDAGKEGKPGEGKEGKEGKDGKAGEGKDGKGKEGKDGKPGDGKGGKEGKPGEGKDGKGGEGKEGKPGQGKDGKGGEGKEGKPGQGKDGKGGEGKAGQGKDGKGGEGKPGAGKEGKEGKPGDGKGGSGKDGKPGAGKDGKGGSGKGKPGEGKPGAGKPSGKPGETKAGSGKPSNGKPGAGKPGDGKPGAGKPGESKRGSDVKAKGDGKGEAKGGKPGAGKPGASGAKPGQGKSGGKSGAGKPGQGKPGASQGGKPGSSGDSQAGKPGDSKPQEVTDARKKIKDSNKYQDNASKDLDQDKKPKASEDMAKAIEKMKEAQKKLEELLRQLREEEIERLLAKLQGRCQKMLADQIAVYEATKTLDKTIQGNEKKQPARGDIQASNKLSDDEELIVLEANTAIRLIEAEGSAVAFGEVFKQVRTDMITVAANLRRTDTGAVTQTVEKDIIDTLTEMVEALKEARKQNKKPSKPGKPGSGGGKPQDQKLINMIAELKMIRARQLRINNRTTVYGKQYEGEQVPAPEKAKTPKERETLEILQKQLKQLATQQEKMSKVTNDIAKGKNEAK